MNNIPSAEEFIKQELKSSGASVNDDPTEMFTKNDWYLFMREFAKLHVKAALQTCIEEAPSGSSTDTVSYEDVKNALEDCYPLKNIK